jgi:hypothetical protein
MRPEENVRSGWTDAKWTSPSSTAPRPPLHGGPHAAPAATASTVTAPRSYTNTGFPGPGRAGLFHERAEHALVAGHRAGVRRGRGGSEHGGAHLQHGHADASLGAVGQGFAQPLAVTVGLEIERDRADAMLTGERGHPFGRIDDGGVAARDHGVEPEPSPGGEGVDGEVAALRDERDRARLDRPKGVAPERRPLLQRDDPVPVRPTDGEAMAPRRVPEAALGVRAGNGRVGSTGGRPPAGHGRHLAEPRPVYDRAPAPQRACLVDDRRTPAAGIATSTASGGDGRSASEGKHRTPCASDRRGFTPQTAPR